MLFGLVLADQHAEAPVGLGRLVDRDHDPAKGADRDRGPAGELHCGPAFEHHPRLVARLDQRDVAPVDEDFHHPFGAEGHEGRQHVTGAHKGGGVACVEALDKAVARGAQDLRGLARQADIGAVERSLRRGDLPLPFGNADLRRFKIAPRGEPGLIQLAHPAFVELGGGERGLRGDQLGRDLAAFGLQPLDQLGIDVGNPHDRIALLHPAAVAHIPLLDPAGHQRVDILLALVGVERGDRAAPGRGLHPGGVDQEHQDRQEGDQQHVEDGPHHARNLDRFQRSEPVGLAGERAHASSPRSSKLSSGMPDSALRRWRRASAKSAKLSNQRCSRASMCRNRSHPSAASRWEK